MPSKPASSTMRADSPLWASMRNAISDRPTSRRRAVVRRAHAAPSSSRQPAKAATTFSMSAGVRVPMLETRNAWVRIVALACIDDVAPAFHRIVERVVGDARRQPKRGEDARARALRDEHLKAEPSPCPARSIARVLGVTQDTVVHPFPFELDQGLLESVQDLHCRREGRVVGFLGAPVPVEVEVDAAGLAWRRASSAARRASTKATPGMACTHLAALAVTKSIPSWEMSSGSPNSEDVASTMRRRP